MSRTIFKTQFKHFTFHIVETKYNNVRTRRKYRRPSQAKRIMIINTREFNGNEIFLNTFLNACNTATQVAVDDQQKFLALHIKNNLKRKAAELVIHVIQLRGFSKEFA